MATLSNEQKIKMKLFNNSTSDTVNQQLIDLLQTVNLVQYSPPRSPTVRIADTPVCNSLDNSIQDIPPVPIVDTSLYNNKSVLDIRSPLSDTVSL